MDWFCQVARDVVIAVLAGDSGEAASLAELIAGSGEVGRLRQDCIAIA